MRIIKPNFFWSTIFFSLLTLDLPPKLTIDLIMNSLLIVEDEPLLSGVYQNTIESLCKEGKIPHFKTNIALNAKDALFYIAQSKKTGQPINFCILDFRLGKFQGKEDENGLTIGLKIRECYPDCKVLIITSVSDGYILNSILNELKPDGFLIKSDIDLANFKRDIIAILAGQMIYSKKVKEFVMRSSKIFKSIDERDLKMIHLMDKGLTLPEIGSRLGLSISGIEYRKRKIAQNLGATSSNINDLLAYIRKDLNLL